MGETGNRATECRCNAGLWNAAGRCHGEADRSGCRSRPRKGDGSARNGSHVESRRGEISQDQPVERDDVALVAIGRPKKRDRTCGIDHRIVNLIKSCCKLGSSSPVSIETKQLPRSWSTRRNRADVEPAQPIDRSKIGLPKNAGDRSLSKSIGPNPRNRVVTIREEERRSRRRIRNTERARATLQADRLWRRERRDDGAEAWSAEPA